MTWELFNRKILAELRLTVLTRADSYFNDRVTDLSGRFSLRKHIFRWSRQRNIQKSRNIGRRETGTGSLWWGKWRGGNTILERSLGQFWQRKDWCALLQATELTVHKSMKDLEIHLKSNSVAPKHQIIIRLSGGWKERTNNPADNPKILGIHYLYNKFESL